MPCSQTPSVCVPPIIAETKFAPIQNHGQNYTEFYLFSLGISRCRALNQDVGRISTWKAFGLERPWYNRGTIPVFDRLCGLVVTVPGYKSRGPGFDSRRYQIFWEVVGLERGTLSLVSTIEELLGRKSSDSGLGIRCADRMTPSVRKSWHQLRRQAAATRSV
jgi:hypothetical protein